MKSDSEENRDEDSDEAADKQEGDYGSGKEKSGKKLPKVKESSGKKKADTYDPAIRSWSSLDRLIPKPWVLNPQPNGNTSYEGHGSL